MVPVVVGADESLKLVEEIEGIGIWWQLDSHFCIYTSLSVYYSLTQDLTYCLSHNLAGHRCSWRSCAGGDDCAKAHFLKY